MVIDDFKRPSLRRRRNGAEVVGMIIAPVRRGRSNRAAAQSRLAEHGARRCEQQAECDGAPGRPGPAGPGREGTTAVPAEMCGGVTWHAGVLDQGWGCGRITQKRKMQREGRETCDSSELYFEARHPWPGPAPRRGRGNSDGCRPPVGGRFRQSGPVSRLTPAFGLRSLRM